MAKSSMGNNTSGLAGECSNEKSPSCTKSRAEINTSHQTNPNAETLDSVQANAFEKGKELKLATSKTAMKKPRHVTPVAGGNGPVANRLRRKKGKSDVPESRGKRVDSGCPKLCKDRNGPVTPWSRMDGRNPKLTVLQIRKLTPSLLMDCDSNKEPMVAASNVKDEIPKQTVLKTNREESE